MSGLLFGSGKQNNTIAPELGLHVQTSAYGNPLPIVYGTNRTSGNLIWYGDFKAVPNSSGAQGGKGGGGGGGTTQYDYSASFMMAVCEGEISGIGKIWIDNKLHETNDVFTVFNGSYSQSPWGYLITNFEDEALNYRGISYIAVANYALGSSANLPNHSLEIKGILSDDVDANPADIIRDFLTNAHYGAGFDINNISNLDYFETYCTALGIGLSPIFDSQTGAFKNIETIINLCNSGIYYSEGKLKIVPFGDQVITANGVTWTPNVTPIYSFNDDDFIPDGQQPIIVTRNTPADAFNRVKIEFVNRANNYNTQVETASDLVNAEIFGLREDDTLTAHEICTADVAQTVAQIMLQRATYIRNTYEFTVGLKYCALEPTDYITVTDHILGLESHPVRILSIEESDDLTYKITAEDAPPGVSSRAIYSTPSVDGFVQNYDVDPGDVIDPVFFEPPVEFAPTTGLEVWCAIAGSNSNWGGCGVWISTDGDTYTFLTRFQNISQYGHLTGALASDNDTANILFSGNQPNALVSKSDSDVNLLRSMCYVSGSSSEFVGYKDVSLTGENAYEVTFPLRGIYASSPHNHPINSKIVIINEALVKSNPLQDIYVGNTIYFKFTSFNIYGGNEQSLFDVLTYAYTVTGEMLRLPPENATSFVVTTIDSGIQLTWVASTDPLISGYEIRQGDTWNAATSLGFYNATAITLPPVVTANYSFLIKAVDKYNNPSLTATQATLIATSPLAPTLAIVQNGLDYVLNWSVPGSMFKIDYYVIYTGDDELSLTEVEKTYSTSIKNKINFSGNFKFWVRAVDIAGNVSQLSSTTLNIIKPSIPSIRADVVDNNVLLYWNDSTTALNIVYYDILKGDVLATAQAIGTKQGLFTSVFENQAGVYKYWIAGVDAAGNVGEYGYVQVNVNQPPDYLLRDNILSVFDGTKNNALLENSELIMPVNLTETWTEHYVNNGFATPQAQISAGYPYYLMPTPSSGYYEEIIDLGATLPATNIHVYPTLEVIAGSPTYQVDISVSNVSSSSGYVDYLNSTNVFAVNFRWIKIRITVSTTGGNDLLKLIALQIKLDVKTKTDNGAGTASASDSGGTTVLFNATFVSVASIIVTANSTNSITPTYIFDGSTINPTQFKVMLFDSSGTRVSGAFSWVCKGF